MERKQKSLLKKLGITALISAIVIISGTYAGLSMFFTDHYYYNTTINGDNYSYKTPVEVEDMIYQEANNYFLTIEGREGIREIILPSEISLNYIFDDSLTTIKREQKPGLWILGFFKDYSYDIPRLVDYNEDELSERIQRLAFTQIANIRTPNDAYLVYSIPEKEYIVIEATPGTEIIEEKFVKVITNAIDNLDEKVNLEDSGCYETAAINSDSKELIDAAEIANKYVNAQIVYDWNGSEVLVDADVIEQWITIENNNVSLDGDQIKEFVSEQAKKYDTYGKNRIFHTTDGREIELKSGAYGWKTDKDTEIAALIQAVKSGNKAKRTPAYSYTASASGVDDIGNTYVEIDLGNQHLYLYVDGEIILESDFVSGNESRGWSTPAGVFGLTYKTRNAVLRGENYETPVTYWMPFNGNIGMHDATWRGTFGGSIYKTSGSHGCINMPFENAKIIYEYLYTGFPVICYY